MFGTTTCPMTPSLNFSPPAISMPAIGLPSESHFNLQGAASPLADADLPGGTALRSHRGALRHRRPDQWAQLPGLHRADLAADTCRRRHRHHGQSRQPQTPSRPPPAAHRWRQAVLPAALLARPQPDRAGLRKLKTLLRKADERSIEATWKRIGALLDHFTPQECANYLINSGYASA